jgi:hypothetical protein
MSQLAVTDGNQQIINQADLLSAYKLKQELWLDRRFNWLTRAKSDSEFRDALWFKCKQDPIFFINLTSVAFNPNDGGLQPLVLFQRQEEAILFMNDVEKGRNYGTIVKSRYVGASVFSTAYLAHSLIFKRDWTGLIMSRVLTLVDSSNDPDCLFAKVDLAIDYLPDWMRPKLNRKLGLIQNPMMNSNIKGTGGSNAGRGGRATVVVVDEAAFIDQAASVFAALSNTSQCCIFISTPKGRNEFYRLASNRSIPNFIYHWRSDPRRDDVWYAKECGKFDPWVIAQELDCSFNGSQENGLIDTFKLDSCIEYSNQIPENTEEVIVGFDVAAGGKNNSVMAVRKGRKVIAIFALDKGLSIPQQAGYVHNYCKENNVSSLVFDADGIGLAFKDNLNDVQDSTYSISAFHGGSKASDVETASGREASAVYGNARSEAWHGIRDAVNYTFDFMQGKLDSALFDSDKAIGLVNCPELLVDLGKPMSVPSATGKMLCESKISMKKRGLESPDYADALCYCFYASKSTHDTSWLE